jgi:tripartite-type tricarboxylate transporter receptor subunit TctC
MKIIISLIFTLFISVSNAQEVIKILVGFPPGGGNYILGQLVAESLERQGHKSIVESKPGAGGILAMNDCAQRNSEKNLLCLVSQTQYVHSIYLPNDIRKFDPDKLSYIKIMGATPLVLITNKNNTKTLSEIISDLRDPNKRKIFGVSSVGLKITTNWFLQQSKAKFSDLIDYKGGNQVVADLIGGHIHYSIGFYAGHKQMADQNTIKIVALIGDSFQDQELLGLPKIQKFIPNMDENTQKFGFVRGEGTDKSIIESLDKLLIKVLDDPIFKEKARKEGFFLYNSKITSEEFFKISIKERENYKIQIQSMPDKPF